MLDLSLPTGLRDLLPDHSAHLAELSGRLQEVFAGFGYRRLFLPTLERLEVVERGLSLLEPSTHFWLPLSTPPSRSLLSRQPPA